MLGVVGCCACGHPVAPTLTFELGTGQTSFETVTDGQTLQIQTGTQGAFHLWGATRSQGLDASACDLICSLTFTGSGQAVSSPSAYRVNLIADGDWDVATGIICYIGDAQVVAGVRGQTVTMTMEAKDDLGVTASDTRTVVAQ
jgi:hypothetical protein